MDGGCLAVGAGDADGDESTGGEAVEGGGDAGQGAPGVVDDDEGGVALSASGCHFACRSRLDDDDGGAFVEGRLR